MKRVLTIFVLMVLLSIPVAVADEIGGGGSTAKTQEEPKKTDTTPTPTTANAHLYRGPGTTYKVYDAPPAQIPEGYTYVGGYTLTDRNLAVLGSFQNAPAELVTMSNNKVVFRNKDGSLDISVGDSRIEDWAGPDEFSYDSTKPAGRQTLFDGRPIVADLDMYGMVRPDKDGNYHFIDPASGKTLEDEYITPIKGGFIESKGDKVTIYGTQGNVLGTLDKDEWGKFSTVNKNDLVAVSAQLGKTGLSLNDVTPYKQTIGTTETTVFIYDADFGDDVRVYVQDGKQVREEGSFDKTKPAEFKPEEKNVFNTDGTLASRTTYNTDTGAVTSSYTYGQDTLTIQVLDKDGKTLLPPETFSVARDSNGNVVGYELGTYGNKKVYYDPITDEYKYADGSEVPDDVEKLVDADTTTKDKKEKIDDAEAARRDAEPWRWEEAWRRDGLWGLVKEFFAGYEAFRGLGAYGALFWDEEELYERRLKVREAFCKTVVLGGVECWTSKLCERYTDQHTGSNTLVTVVPGQSVRAAAHIEAERTETTEFQNESGTFGLYLYRVTFFASSPKDDNSVQLRFYYDGGTYDWFPEPQPIEAGGVVSASGAAAIVSYGKRDYTQVCLMLSEGIEVGTGSSVSEICAPIVDSGLSPSGGVESVPGAPGIDTSPAAGQPGAGF